MILLGEDRQRIVISDHAACVVELVELREDREGHREARSGCVGARREEAVQVADQLVVVDRALLPRFEDDVEQLVARLDEALGDHLPEEDLHVPLRWKRCPRRPVELIELLAQPDLPLERDARELADDAHRERARQLGGRIELTRSLLDDLVDHLDREVSDHRLHRVDCAVLEPGLDDLAQDIVPALVALEAERLDHPHEVHCHVDRPVVARVR